MCLALERGRPSFAQDFSCPALLRILTTSLPHAYGTLTPFGRPSQIVRLRSTTLLSVLQPRQTRPTVWALPLSLATTRRILSSPRTTKMFQFVRFPPSRVSRHDPGRVSPFGHLRLYGCTRLTGAFRSVPRPSSALDAKASTVCPYSLIPCDTEKLMLLRYAYALVNLRPDVATGEGMASLTSVSTSRTCLRTHWLPDTCRTS